MHVAVDAKGGKNMRARFTMVFGLTCYYMEESVLLVT